MREASLVEHYARLAALGQSRHFGKLDGAAARTLARATTFRTVGAGRSLWRAGDRATAAMQIVDGAVLIMAARADGREVALGVFGPGESIGLTAVLGGTPYPASALALAPHTRVLVIHATALHEAMALDAACERAVRTALIDHSATLRMQVDVLAAGSVPARLATFLLYLGDRFGTITATGGVQVPMALPKTVLAKAIATRAETVMRCLAAWKRQRIAVVGRTGIELRARGRLAELAQQG